MSASAGRTRTPEWLTTLPLVRSLAGYGGGDVRADIAAGATVGVMLIPQGMAYALVAGLPPVYGLYAALVPLAVYAALGTSRQLAVGPVAMVSLLVADGVGPLAADDPTRFAALAVVLAGLVGLIQFGLGVAKGGFLVNLLSHPVLAGFTSAAAIIIGMSQLGSLTGITLDKAPVHEMLIQSASQWRDGHGPTVLLGVGAIAAGVGLRRIAPRVPAPIIVVAVGTAIAWVMDLKSVGVAVVGEIPSGLPVPSLPWAGLGSGPRTGPESGLGADTMALLPTALAISLVGFMESIAVAKVYATRNRYDLDADQELRALGLANIVGAFFQAFPVTGGFSRTAVNAQAGARTQLSSLISVGVILVTLLFLTPLFHTLPKAILAAIIVVAVAGLVDLAGAVELWRVDRQDFALMMLTFLATLVFGIEEGILAGAAMSLAVVVHQISTPHIAILGRVPGTRQFRNIERHDGAEIADGTAVLRLDASLFYGNADAFRTAARRAFRSACSTASHDRTPRLVIDAYPMNRVDSTGLHVLSDLVREIREAGGEVHFAGAKGALATKLERAGLVQSLGPDCFHADCGSALDAHAPA